MGEERRNFVSSDSFGEFVRFSAKPRRNFYGLFCFILTNIRCQTIGDRLFSFSFEPVYCQSDFIDIELFEKSVELLQIKLYEDKPSE